MRATVVAQRWQKYPVDYKEIARVLSPIFSNDKKPVVLLGRACRERMDGLILKYLEEDERKYLILSKWETANTILKVIFVTTANGKPQTASSLLPFAVNAMLNVSTKTKYPPGG